MQLRNFTLNGFPIGDIFVVGTVEMPFMNVERRYYQVGHTNGQHLLGTRLGATTITVNGHLIKDHTGLTVSEMKDLLVAALWTEEPQQMVFDAQPDRYYNVLYEGAQSYDATDLGITPLTLTFTCPDGIAHSLTEDNWTNITTELDVTQNRLIDTQMTQFPSFQWRPEVYKANKVLSNQQVLALDYTDVPFDELEEIENDFFDADFHISQDTPFSPNKGVIACSIATQQLDPDETHRYEDGRVAKFGVDFYDHQNGKLLGTQELTIKNTNQGRKAYAYNVSGTARFTHEMPNPNLFNDGLGDTLPYVNRYGTATVTQGDQVTYYEGYNLQSYTITGGNSNILATITTGKRTVGGLPYSHQITIANLGTVPFRVDNNLGVTWTIEPSQKRVLKSEGCVRSEGLTPAALQFVIQSATGQALLPTDKIVLAVGRAKIEQSDHCTVFTLGDYINETGQSGQTTTDNTTPTHEGVSFNNDPWTQGMEYNRLVNGRMNKDANWTPVPNSEVFSKMLVENDRIKLIKTAENTGRCTLGQNVYNSNNIQQQRITRGGTYWGHIEYYVHSYDPNGGSGNDNELLMRVYYQDGTFDDFKATLDITNRQVWRSVSIECPVKNKDIRSADFIIAINAKAITDISVRRAGLYEREDEQPWYPAQSEVTETFGYTGWSPTGTVNIDNYTPMENKYMQFTIPDGCRCVKPHIWVRGNSKVLIASPRLKLGSANSSNELERTTLRDVVEIENYGTADAYPVFEFQCPARLKSIAIFEEEGGVLQFGNEQGADDPLATSNQNGYHYDWASTKKPADCTVNSGHVSQYPAIYNDPEKPNLYLGDWDYTKKDVIVPKWSNSYGAGVWSGMSMTTPVKSRTSGARNGAYKVEERMHFGTNKEQRGRYELCIINDSNDIVQSMTLRDSSPDKAEIIMENWLGDRRVRDITLDLKKVKGTFFRMTMTRSEDGKHFEWLLENIEFRTVKGKTSIYTIASWKHTHNEPVGNRTNIAKTSRWLLGYDKSKAQQSYKSHTDYSYEVTPSVGLHVRTGAGSNYRSLKVLKKGTKFTTPTRKVGQKVVNNNIWVYTNGGWCSEYWLKRTKTVEVYKKREVDAHCKMEVTDSNFTWLGSSDETKTDAPFQAFDIIRVDTGKQTITVNGSDREDLASIGNQWSKFPCKAGKSAYTIVVKRTDNDENTRVAFRVKLHRHYQ